jgi:hypothetical protein
MIRDACSRPADREAWKSGVDLPLSGRPGHGIMHRIYVENQSRQFATIHNHSAIVRSLATHVRNVPVDRKPPALFSGSGSRPVARYGPDLVHYPLNGGLPAAQQIHPPSSIPETGPCTAWQDGWHCTRSRHSCPYQSATSHIQRSLARGGHGEGTHHMPESPGQCPEPFTAINYALRTAI